MVCSVNPGQPNCKRRNFPAINAHGQLDAQAPLAPNVDPAFPSVERILRLSSGAGSNSVKDTVADWLSASEKRTLMLPTEIKELPSDDALLFLEGCKPIRCKKNWSFKDRVFKKRILPPVEIATMGVVADKQLKTSKDGKSTYY